jgi:hypothetical protein
LSGYFTCHLATLCMRNCRQFVTVAADMSGSGHEKAALQFTVGWSPTTKLLVRVCCHHLLRCCHHTLGRQPSCGTCGNTGGLCLAIYLRARGPAVCARARAHTHTHICTHVYACREDALLDCMSMSIRNVPTYIQPYKSVDTGR